MPGDVLMCTWNDATDAGGTQTKRSFKSKAEEQTIKLSTLPGMPSFSDKTSVWGKKGYSDYRKFLVKQLIDNDTPVPLQYQEIEDTCWNHVQSQYSNAQFPDQQTKKLWKVFNRLCNVGEYPAIVSQKTAEWLMENVGKIFSQDTKKIGRKVKANGLTFQEFQQHWATNFVKAYNETAIENCIDEIYRWLVIEESKVGWMFRRTKKQANWTPWTKMWFVLTPCKLNYYETPSDRNEAGEVILSADIEVKGLSKIKGVVQEFEERFHLMEGPQSITECRVKSADDRVAWVAAIDAAKYASNIERTPMQLLLSRLSSESDSDATNTRKDIEACREIMKKTNISVASEPVEHTNISKDDREDQAYDKKFKAAFCKIDTSGNGLIDMAEFSVFFKQLGLNMDEEGVRKIFNTIDVDKSGQLSLDEFTNYFTAMVVKDESDDSSEDYLRKAFMEADRDKTGCLDFKEFSDYVWDKKRDKRMGKVMEAFNKMTAGGKRSLTPEQFADLTKAHISTGDTTDSADIDPKLGNQLQKFFEDVEGDEIVEFIEERWDVFTGFKRYDKTGQLVMTGAEEMVADFVPGQYSLVDLACFSDLPPIEPNYRTVKATWKTSTVKGKSGQIIFPADFDGKVPLDIATSEHLRYYGCSFADTKQTKISLLYRHGIQDFTYENAYLDDFVLATRGGAGLETHQFAHLDCPVDDDNGVFVLGKLVDDDTLHLTGFTVPQRHTLYLPAGAIHSNDYLKGTWRTMLSDEAIIDHVVTMAEKKDSDELRNVTLTFQ